MSPTTIPLESQFEKHWLQVSYVVDVLGYARTDTNEILPPGTIGEFRTSESEGVLTFNIVIPKSFPSSCLRSVGIQGPDCSLRAGQEESGDPDRHILKLAVNQFPASMMEHLEFFKTLEKGIGVVDAVPETGGEPRAFLGYGLHSATVRGENYIFRIPADISVRPFAAFIGIDRRQVVREAVVDGAGAPMCDHRGVPLHSFAVPIAAVRAYFSFQMLQGNRTVAFTVPRPSPGAAKAPEPGGDSTIVPR
jgi:hypothetical protein